MREHPVSLNTLTHTYNSLQNRVGIILPVIVIFLLTFLGGGLYNHYSTFNNAHQLGQKAVLKLETYITRTAHDLDRLSLSISDKCLRTDVLKLRDYVFSTNRVKELGAYNSDGRIYCTSNAGKSDVKIFDSILHRLKQSPNRTTISLSIPSSGGLMTFFIFSSPPQNVGIDALIPPRHFLELITPLFKGMAFGYNIRIINRNIEGPRIDFRESNRILIFSSQIYPLSISLQLGIEAYISHFLNMTWMLILIASTLTVIYLIIRDYSRSNHTLDASLRSAIHNNQLKLYLQPIINSKQRTVVGAEAILRWNDPEKGYISPSIFIPLAEQIGAIKDLTYRVIDYLTSYVDKHKHELEDRYISINISRILVLDEEFISYLYDYAITHPKMIKVLVLEITEDNNYTAEEMEKAVHNLSLLRHLGFKMAVDDFGTGYSGLNFIYQHPFDKLKIDQVFIRSLSQNEALNAVIISMIDLANQLGMGVIAEGVENIDQLHYLERMGVENIQGFYFAKPMPAEEYIGYLKGADKTFF